MTPRKPLDPIEVDYRNGIKLRVWADDDRGVGVVLSEMMALGLGRNFYLSRVAALELGNALVRHAEDAQAVADSWEALRAAK